MKDIKLSPAEGPDFPEGLLRLEYSSSWGDDFKDWALINPGAKETLWSIFLHGTNSHGDQLYTRRDVRGALLPEYMKRGSGILTPEPAEQRAHVTLRSF